MSASRDRPYSRASRLDWRMSGRLSSVSHLETVWRLTPSFSATASWDRPDFFRAADRLLPKFMKTTPFL